MLVYRPKHITEGIWYIVWVCHLGIRSAFKPINLLHLRAKLTSLTVNPPLAAGAARAPDASATAPKIVKAGILKISLTTTF